MPGTRIYRVERAQVVEKLRQLAPKFKLPEEIEVRTKIDGVQIEAKYRGSELTISWLSKPFLAPAGMIWSRLEAKLALLGPVEVLKELKA